MSVQGWAWEPWRVTHVLWPCAYAGRKPEHSKGTRPFRGQTPHSSGPALVLAHMLGVPQEIKPAL